MAEIEEHKEPKTQAEINKSFVEKIKDLGTMVSRYNTIITVITITFAAAMFYFRFVNLEKNVLFITTEQSKRIELIHKELSHRINNLENIIYRNLNSYNEDLSYIQDNLDNVQNKIKKMSLENKKPQTYTYTNLGLVKKEIEIPVKKEYTDTLIIEKKNTNPTPPASHILDTKDPILKLKTDKNK